MVVLEDRASAVAISVLPRPTTSPISTPPRLFRWWAAILTRRPESRTARCRIRRDAELGEAGARLLREVVGHLEVDVVGRDGLFARPAPSMISASSSEMSRHQRSFQRSSNHCELARRIVIEHVDVELALARSPANVRLLLPR